jgi:hypothetical protein
MLIAYLTTDEVNQDLALRMAEECGITLCLLSPSDPPPNGKSDAVLYDCDSLPGEQWQAILAELLAGQGLQPVAVHSYNLDEECIQALRRQDVAVYRTLQPEVFRLLALAGIYVQATNAPGSGREENQPFEERFLRRLRQWRLGRQGLADPFNA